MKKNRSLKGAKAEERQDDGTMGQRFIITKEF
jgi:hypothetical protein